MSKHENNPGGNLRFWVMVALFFTIGSAIGIVTTLALIDSGGNTGVALVFGASAGGAAASILFSVVATIRKNLNDR